MMQPNCNKYAVLSGLFQTTRIKGIQITRCNQDFIATKIDLFVKRIKFVT